MPNMIVKPHRDVDFYVNWSTIVDAPLSWGTRADFANWPNEGGRYDAERFDRADACGTSALWYQASWEDDELYSYDNFGTVRRSQLPELCESLDDTGGATTATMAMLTPFET